jgi:hypothetical protein
VLLKDPMHISSETTKLRSVAHKSTNSRAPFIICRLRLVCSALALSAGTWRAYSQFTDPRNHQNSPVGVNQVELAYAYAHSDASINPSIIIADARLDLNQGTIGSTRYCSFLPRMVWVSPSLPIAGLSRSNSTTKVSGSRVGAGDSSYEAAMLVLGGPALSVAEFATYQPSTTVGISFGVTAPKGSYESDEILNPGYRSMVVQSRDSSFVSVWSASEVDA